MFDFGTAWLVWITEVPLYYLLMSGVAQRKYSVVANLLIGSGLATIMTGVNILNQNNGIFNAAMTFFAVILYSRLCYKITLRRAVFFSGVINLILVIAEFAAIAFASAILGTNADGYKYSDAFLLISTVFSRAVQFVCAVLIRGIFRQLSNRTRLPVHVILFPFVTVISIAMIEYIGIRESFSAESYRILVTASVFMLVTSAIAILTQFHFLETQEEYQLLKTESVRYQTERDYYAILEEQNNALMIYAHDAKKHLAAIRSLNDNPEVIGYVDCLSDQLHTVTQVGHSGNKLLDVMLSKYSFSCRQKNIHFDYDVKLCNLTQLQDIDLVAILGNLMDNAVTAADVSMGKEIHLSTAHRNSYDILIISNSCDIPPIFQERTLFTSKENVQSHGYGIKSVQRTLAKYGGDFDWEYDESTHIFTATAMIGTQ